MYGTHGLQGHFWSLGSWVPDAHPGGNTTATLSIAIKDGVQFLKNIADLSGAWPKTLLVCGDSFNTSEGYG